MEILGTYVSNLGVDHRRAELADLHEDDPHRRADLRRGECATHVVLLAGGAERIPEVVRKQPHRRRLGVFNRGAADPQDRVTELANASHCHGRAKIAPFGASCNYPLAITPLSGLVS